MHCMKLHFDKGKRNKMKRYRNTEQTKIKRNDLNQFS